MSTGIQITSNNFNGHTADITFYPDTGGTVSLGSHVIPYTTTLDYVYGVYEFYIPLDNRTCFCSLNNPDTNYLLQENGFTLDQEDGSKILIT